MSLNLFYIILFLSFHQSGIYKVKYLYKKDIIHIQCIPPPRKGTLISLEPPEDCVATYRGTSLLSLSSEGGSSVTLLYGHKKCERGGWMDGLFVQTV